MVLGLGDGAGGGEGGGVGGGGDELEQRHGWLWKANEVISTARASVYYFAFGRFR